MNVIDKQWLTTECARGPQRVAKRPLRIQLYMLLISLDLLCVVGGLTSGALLRFGQVFVTDWFGVTASVVALYGVAAVSLGAYTLDVLRSPSKGTARASGALLMAFLLLFLLFYFLKVDPQISRAMTGSSFVLSFIGIGLVRQCVGNWILRALGGCFTTELLLIDGAEDQEEIPDGESYLYAIGVGVSIVG